MGAASGFRAARLILAVSIGAAGGALFWVLSLPLPWMLGAISATMLAALSRLPLAVPRWVRPPLSAVVGTLLGAGFPNDVFARLVDWVVPMAGLLAFMLVAGTVCVWYFHRICGYEIRTAFFCGMPGGLVEMTLLGETLGADGRRIALIHTVRILLVVFVVSGATRFYLIPTDAVVGAVAGGPRLMDLTWSTAIWVAVTGFIGVEIARAVHLPAGFLLGPMLVSATLHILNLTDFEIPRELAYVAQVGLGTTIGCRFVGQTFREVGRTILLCLGSTAILLALTMTFAVFVHFATGLDPLLLVLAYSPGGLAEMGLIALIFHFDTAFVTCHHLARVVLVGFSAGYIFTWFGQTNHTRHGDEA